MAVTGPGLVRILQQHQRVASARLGITLAQMPIEPRAVLQLSNGTLASLVLLLVAKGVVTEAELMAAVAAADQWAFTPEPAMPDPSADPSPGA
jgi:hypothetical protein